MAAAGRFIKLQRLRAKTLSWDSAAILQVSLTESAGEAIRSDPIRLTIFTFLLRLTLFTFLFSLTLFTFLFSLTLFYFSLQSNAFYTAYGRQNRNDEGTHGNGLYGRNERTEKR